MQTNNQSNQLPLPVWLLAIGGGTVIAASAFAAGNFWSSRRRGLVSNNFNNETEVYVDRDKPCLTTNLTDTHLFSAAVGEKGEKQE